METLSSAIVISSLEMDVQKLCKIYENDANYEISISDFCLRRGDYQSPRHLYDSIVHIIKHTSYVVELLEMMPYIDDYIALYFD